MMISVLSTVSAVLLYSYANANTITVGLDVPWPHEDGRSKIGTFPVNADGSCSLLKARLSTWGLSLRIENPGEEHPVLRQHWAEEHEVIGRSLFGIKDIFENASLLAERYKLTPRRSRSLRSIVQIRGNEQHPIEDDATLPKSSATSWSFLRRRTVWAIHDKQKFERFIQDLSFLIENLEKVTERLSMPTLQRDSYLTKQSNISGIDQRALVIAEGQDRSKESHKDASHQPVKPPPRPGKHVYREDEHFDLRELASQLNGAVFTGSQRTAGGAVVMGSVGKSDKRRHLHTGNQTATKQGLAVMGNISDKAASRLQQPSTSHGKSVAAVEGSDQSASEDSSSTSTEEEVPRRETRVIRVTKR